MDEKLDQAFSDLDPHDYDQIMAYSVAVIDAGEWREDIAHTLAHMVFNFHQDRFDEFLRAISCELRRPPCVVGPRGI